MIIGIVCVAAGALSWQPLDTPGNGTPSPPLRIVEWADDLADDGDDEWSDFLGDVGFLDMGDPAGSSNDSSFEIDGEDRHWNISAGPALTREEILQFDLEDVLPEPSIASDAEPSQLNITEPPRAELVPRVPERDRATCESLIFACNVVRTYMLILDCLFQCLGKVLLPFR